MNNVALDPSYSKIRQLLNKNLLDVLQKNLDPRLIENPCRFEFEPFAGPLSKEQEEDSKKHRTREKLNQDLYLKK